MVTSVLGSLLHGSRVRRTMLVFFSAHTDGCLKIARLSMKRSDRKVIMTTVASFTMQISCGSEPSMLALAFCKWLSRGRFFWASVRIFGHLPCTVVELSSRHPYLQTVVVVLVVVPRELTAYFVIDLSDLRLYLESWCCAWLRRYQKWSATDDSVHFGFFVVVFKGADARSVSTVWLRRTIWTSCGRTHPSNP